MRNVKDIMKRLREIESCFYALEDEFAFPGKLDFVSPSSPTARTTPVSTPASVTSQLAYTATNHPVRYYEQGLTGLLAQLDSIESNGSEEVRNKRKEVVRKVEHALEELEQRVEVRWKESRRRSVVVEDVTSPNEHLMVPEEVPAHIVTEGDQASPATEEPLSTSTTTHEAEGPVSGGVSVKETHKPTVEKPAQAIGTEHVIPEVAEATEPVLDQTQGISGGQPEADLPKETSNPATVQEITLSEASESVVGNIPDSHSPAEAESASTKQRLAPSQHPEPAVGVILYTGSDNSVDESPVADHSASVEPVTIPSIELQDDDLSQSQPDLAATIRPFTHVAFEEHQPGSKVPDSEMESDLSETEADGLLLENGVVQASHDISDTESTSSDWSEVDAAGAH
jgi:hypothetical protein